MGFREDLREGVAGSRVSQREAVSSEAWATLGGFSSRGHRELISLLRTSLAAFGQWTVGRQEMENKGFASF